MLFLTETRCNGICDKKISANLDFDVAVPAISPWSGGVTSMWRNNVNINKVSAFLNLIVTGVTDSSQKWIVACIYGHPA